jgi:hypothetical protein
MYMNPIISPISIDLGSKNTGFCILHYSNPNSLLKEGYTIEVNNGLLNRRGFTYLTEELDEELIKNIDLEVFRSYYPNSVFDFSRSLFEQLISLGEEIHAEGQGSKLEEIKEHHKEHPFKQFLKDDTQVNLDKEEQKLLEEQYGAIHSYIVNLDKSKQDGHYHRSSYFKNIRRDIENSQSILQPIIKQFGSAERFSNLVCNLSNL